MGEKQELFDPYFSDYQDRGIQKWNGFYLSEHSFSINQIKKKQAIVLQKRKMSENEIGQVLEFAFNNRRQLAVQLEMTDLDGHYFDDTCGFIEGFDELGLMIGQTKVHYDEIRNIELLSTKKWSDCS